MKKLFCSLLTMSSLSVCLAQSSLGNTTAYLQNTPIYLEPSLNSPIIAAVPAKTKLEIIGYQEDTSMQRITDPQNVLNNNLFFKVEYTNMIGFVHRYYVQTDNDVEAIWKKVQDSHKLTPKPTDTKTTPKNEPTKTEPTKPDKKGKKGK